MAASAAGALALKWLAEAEEIRAKSPNIQRRLSGQLERNIKKLTEMVRSLVGMAETIGDPLFLKMRNNELSQQLSESRTAHEKTKKDLAGVNKQLKDLKAQLGPLNKDREGT